MNQEFEEALSHLHADTSFLAWKEKNADSFLTHGFFMSGNDSNWQVGYYDPEDDLITTFSVEDAITIGPKDKPFKKGKKILPVDTKDIKIGAKHAIAIAKKIQEEKYPLYRIRRYILLIQHLPLGQVWNITFVLLSCNTLNIKLDALTGRCLQHKLICLSGQ